MSTLACVALVLVPLASGAAATGGQPALAGEGGASAVRAGASITTVNGFVENRGQWPEGVLFFGRQGKIDVTVTRDALVFRPRPEPAPDPLAVGPQQTIAPEAPLVLKLPVGEATTIAGVDPGPTRHHYFLGPIEVTDALGFASVRYTDVQPGIDLVLRTDGQGLFEYDLHVAAGAQLADFALEFDGVERVETRSATELVLHTASGPVVQRLGASWQPGAPEGSDLPDLIGTRKPIDARFQVKQAEDGLRLGFHAPGRDVSRALVIDPTLEWLTYVGGSGQEVFEEGHRMALDSAGNVYLTCRGAVESPVTPFAFQTEPSPISIVWIGKIGADGSTLVWGTFLGGNAADQTAGIAIDTNGSVVVAGSTWSTDFPTTPGALQQEPGQTGETADVFVTRLRPTGDRLLHSTLFGLAEYEVAEAMALFPNGDVLVGARYGSFFLPEPQIPPATPGAFDAVYDEEDRMLIRFSADLSDVVFLTFIGQMDRLRDLEIDADENVYVCANVAHYQTAPTTPGAYKEVHDLGGPHLDAYVAKLDGSGSTLRWATFLGGEQGAELAMALTIDEAGCVYVTGRTGSVDFPVTPGAFQDTLTPSADGFVAKLLADGSDLAWATLYGPSQNIGGVTMFAVEVDSAGTAYIAGSSNDPGLVTTPDAIQPNFIGVFPNSDIIFARFDAVGERLLYGTWFGGSGSDSIPSLGLHDDGALLAFETFSSNLPATPDAYDTEYAGGSDLAVARFDFPPSSPTIRAAWPGGFSLVGGSPPPPAPSPDGGNSGSTSDTGSTPRLRLSARGAPKLARGLLLMSRAPHDSGRWLLSSPNLLPIHTDENGHWDLILDLPTTPGSLAFQTLFLSPQGDPVGSNAVTAGKVYR